MKKSVRIAALLSLLLVLTLGIQAQTASAQAFSSATTTGMGAAFAYAAQVGPFSMTETGGLSLIGTTDTYSQAGPISGPLAYSSTLTTGPASVFAGSVSSPFGLGSYVQALSFGGFAFGESAAFP